nr:hypothetical protein [Pseudopedobacter sp.]
MPNIQLVFLFFPFVSVFLPVRISNDSDILNHEKTAYFEETAFYSQSWLTRWEAPIKVQCFGNYTLEDKIQVISMIEDVRNDLGTIPIQLVNDGGNLFIHFEDDLSHFNNSEEFKNQQIPFGYMKPQLNRNHELLQADIYIHPALKGIKKHEVLRHEFCHSLGLMSHSSRAYYTENLLGKIIFSNSSAYDVYKSNQHIPILDQEAIKMLYQSQISLKTSKKEFDRMNRNNFL